MISGLTEALMLRGSERGYLTEDEVNDALPVEQMSSEKIEDALTALSDAGIDMVENEDGDEPAAVARTGAGTILIPVHMIDNLRQVTRTSHQMVGETGREPTPEELADKLATPLGRARLILKLVQEPLSLDTPLRDDEDGGRLGDLVADERMVSPIASATAASLRRVTTETLACLTPREEHIVRMRFGIGLNADHTLEEVGKRFSLTREHIRRLSTRITLVAGAAYSTSEFWGGPPNDVVEGDRLACRRP